MAQTIPIAIAKNTNPMSRELPCKDLNLTNENAPTTPSPVPRLPLTASMTTHTRTGKTISVLAKFFDVTPVRIYVTEMIIPKTQATKAYPIAPQIDKLVSVPDDTNAEKNDSISPSPFCKLLDYCAS